MLTLRALLACVLIAGPLLDRSQPDRWTAMHVTRAAFLGPCGGR
jgi:hypothetical protein